MLQGKGFTLMENVIAALLLGIIVTATIFSFATARMYAATARHHYQAINLARDQVEGIIAGEAASPGTVTIDSVPGLTGNLSVTNPTTDSIDVTVTWTEDMFSDVAMSETIVLILP